MGYLTVEEPREIKQSVYRLSRLYGYRNSIDDSIKQIPAEVQVIKYVITTIAECPYPTEAIIQRIISNLSKANVRNRSCKKWIRATIIGLVRPIYAGMVETDEGFLESIHYPAIVPWETLQRALKKLERLSR